MEFLHWINFSWSVLLMLLLSAIGIFVALMIYTRIAGLRSFSKLSNFDFAITVSFGSVIANTLTTGSPIFLQAVLALGLLFAMQIIVASLRESYSWVPGLIDNEPLLLMKGTDIIQKNMKKGKVTEKDVWAKLRQNGVTKRSQIKAVIMETTGDISVMQNSDPDFEVDSKLLEDVEGWEN